MSLRHVSLRVVVVVLASAFLIAFIGRSRVVPATATYVGETTCARCHAEHDRRWQNSDHDRAMSVATSATVLANFDSTPIPHHGLTTTPRREADRFIVRTQSSSGTLLRCSASHVAGYR